MKVEFHVADPLEKRRAPRLGTRVPAKVRRHGPTRIPGVITDLSVIGFRLQSDEKLARGARIWVTIKPFSPLEAEVVWSRAFLAGCSFEAPLHPAVLDHIVAEAG